MQACVPPLCAPCCRAAELADLYRRLAASDGSGMDARLGVLLQAREAAAQLDGGAAGKEALQLIDREIDLLHRHVRGRQVLGAGCATPVSLHRVY